MFILQLICSKGKRWCKYDFFYSVDLGVIPKSTHVLAAQISLVRAADVDQIMMGNDEAFKAVSVNSFDVPTPR